MRSTAIAQPLISLSFVLRRRRAIPAAAHSILRLAATVDGGYRQMTVALAGRT
jgi:hypothetical protein